MCSMRKIRVLVLFFIVLFVFDCSGMRTAKMVSRRSRQVLRYGVPVAVLAVIVYNLYSWFFFAGRIDKNAREANEGIARVDVKVDELDRKLVVANGRLEEIEGVVKQILSDTGLLKDESKAILKELKEFRQETEENFRAADGDRKRINDDLLQRLLDQDKMLDSLKRLIGTVKVDLKVSIADGLEEVRSEYKEMIEMIKQQSSQSSSEIKGGFARNDENYRSLSEKIGRLEVGIGKLLKFHQFQQFQQMKEDEVS